MVDSDDSHKIDLTAVAAKDVFWGFYSDEGDEVAEYSSDSDFYFFGLQVLVLLGKLVQRQQEG